MLELKDATLVVYDHEPDDVGMIRLKATVDVEYTSENAESLARLIEAAPGLLNAVEHVLEASEDNGDMNDIDWDLLRREVANARGH